MIGNPALKAVYHTSDTLHFEYKVVAEWNMNQYYVVNNRGTYISDDVTGGATYTVDDPLIYSGENMLYDEIRDIEYPDPNNRWTSSPDSMFMPLRPDPGIIKLNSVMDGVTVGILNGDIFENIDYQKPRYYSSHSTPTAFDYWNSLKRYDPNDEALDKAGASLNTGLIRAAKPFVEYGTIDEVSGQATASFETNKIVIKTQNHVGYPTTFSVDVLQSGTWNTIYSVTDSDVMESGVLTLYYGPGLSWGVTETLPIKDLTLTNTETISGIRFWVHKMQETVLATASVIPQNYVPHIPLEVIEISPRLQLDLSDCTASFQVNSTMSDQKSGLPVGNLVQGSGTLKLFVPTGEFYADGPLAHLAKHGAKINLSHIFDGVEIPVGEMFAEQWNFDEGWDISIALKDNSHHFAKIPCPDLLLADSRNGVPLSLAIMTILDSIGFTGYEFKAVDGIDPRVRTFFAWNEQSVMEVLDELAKSTQSAMYIDAFGNLVVLTKEYMTRAESMSSVNDWLVGEPSTIADAEHAYIDGYLPNVESIEDETIDPVTDAEITYRHFDVERVPDQEFISTLRGESQELYTSANGADFLESFSKYTLIPESLWGLSDYKQQKTLGYGILMNEVPLETPYEIPAFSGDISAYDKRAAVKSLYFNATNSDKNYLRLMMDVDGLYTFLNQWSGYVAIDSEIIAFYGKIFTVGYADGTEQQEIFFSDEEYYSFINNELFDANGVSGYIIPVGLLIRLDMQRVDYSEGIGTYRLIGDGRGVLGTDVDYHPGINYNLSPKPGNWGGQKFATQIGYNLGLPLAYPTASLRWNARATDSAIVKDIKRRQPLGYLRVEGPAQGNEKSVADAWTGSSKLLNQTTPYNHQRQLGGIFFFRYVQRGKQHVFKTRMTILNNLSNDEVRTSIGGICFGVRFDGSTKNKGALGYFVEFDGKVDTQRDNLRLYWLDRQGTSGSYTGNKAILLGSASVPIAPVPDYGDPGEAQEFATTFDVAVHAVPMSRDRLNIKVYVNGSKALDEIDSRDRMGSAANGDNYAGLFVRGDSQVAFDNFYVQKFAKNNVSSNTFEREFTRAIGEVKEFKVRYQQAMAYRSALLAADNTDERFSIVDNPRVTGNITQYSPKLGPYGAHFYVKNTGNRAYTMDEAGLTLGLSGIVLKELGTGQLSLNDHIERHGYKDSKLTKLWRNRKLFPENGINISTAYVQSEDNAWNILHWIASYASGQRLSIKATTFANPLWEIGDKIRVFYPSRGYTVNGFDKCFVITGRAFLVESDGPSTTFDLMEVDWNGE